ncbi:hypothetical protein ASG31_14765 [Chryseobacterium sp. Leaf404]|uniref:acyltransferase family protein n=1 Tax=unclassified Chryseobacterium TaxID=2593645 RepID=UPI0006F5F56D|nr:MULTISPECIES: acyltransferase [unclassified Chryseobacterium]KQT15519.1 hypothetical protein ASG31_14765 [Chryseobacterium sp. Leaf404]
MKLNNLQILRGISALLVCCFHFRADINFQNLKIGEILFGNGSIGVPIFFVISGFIMAYTNKINGVENKEILSDILLFYKRRVIRIIPLYYILTFAWIVLGASLLLYFTDASLRSRLFHSLLFLPHQNHPPVLYLGWSLNYEMFFYAVFGLSLFFKKKKYIFITLFFLTSYSVGKLLISDNPFFKMLTSNLNLYFVMGIFLAIIFRKITIARDVAVSVSVIGILLFSALFFNFIIIKQELLILLVVTAFVLSFLLFDFALKIKASKILVFFGDISYSLYLSHPFTDIVLRRFSIAESYRIPFFIFKIILSVALAALLYHFIEKKITAYMKTKLNA